MNENGSQNNAGDERLESEEKPTVEPQRERVQLQADSAGPRFSLGFKIFLLLAAIDVLLVAGAVIFYLRFYSPEPGVLASRKTSLGRQWFSFGKLLGQKDGSLEGRIFRPPSFEHEPIVPSRDTAGRSAPEFAWQPNDRDSSFALPSSDEICEGTARAGSRTIGFRSAVAKFNAQRRAVQLGLFTGELSEAQRQALSLRSSLVDDPFLRPQLVATFIFNPFNPSCSLIALSKYSVEFVGGPGGFELPDQQSSVLFERDMAFSGSGEITRLSCVRKAGGPFEVNVSGLAKSTSKAGAIPFEWSFSVKTILQ